MLSIKYGQVTDGSSPIQRTASTLIKCPLEKSSTFPLTRARGSLHGLPAPPT